VLFYGIDITRNEHVWTTQKLSLNSAKVSPTQTGEFSPEFIGCTDLQYAIQTIQDFARADNEQTQ
jgi:hypothetical protein